MVRKKEIVGEKAVKEGRVKVGKLQLNKETVKNLSEAEQGQVKGGAMRRLRTGTDNSCDCGGELL